MMSSERRSAAILLSFALFAGCGGGAEHADPTNDAGRGASVGAWLRPIATADAGLDAAPDAEPDTAPEAAPDAAPDCAPDASAPDAAPEAAPDAVPDASAPDAAPEAAPDAAPDASAPDAAPEAAPDAAPDAAAPDAAPEATLDAAPEAAPDAALDAAPDAPPDAPPDAGPAASLWSSPALPPFDAATVAHVADVFALGASLGRRADVFAKAGDSITASPYALFDVGAGECTLGAYGALSATIDRFSAIPLPDDSNSFDRHSLTAVSGWTTDDALSAPSPFAAELDAISPAYVLVQFGTNDLSIMSVEQFSANLDALVSIAESRGVVVVLSTIPDRPDASDAAATFSGAIRQVAAAHHLPLVDLTVAFAPLPDEGLSDDGIHPSVEMDGATERSCDFTAVGLTYGYDLRNLLALQVLDRLVACR